ncbi:hypothetical protein STEHIDRAFT_47787 [Stereum hirsutum FP-91666 SS1]|nr:hypothetical protein STEHIDRAFT_47787 [Stereum hirsutum FP-91666 SS1]
MPRHLISDAHEWINEIPTVPIYYLAKPQPRERAWQNQRGKKTLLSLTLLVSLLIGYHLTAETHGPSACHLGRVRPGLTEESVVGCVFAYVIMIIRWL